MTSEILWTLAIAGFVSVWAVAPVAALSSRSWAAQFGVPISLSATVLLGYSLYLAGQFTHFLAALTVIAVSSNIVVLVWMRDGLGSFWREARASAENISVVDLAGGFILAVALGAATLYASFFDAVSFAGPAAPDTWSLWGYLSLLASGGSIPGYPPGWFSVIEPARSLLPSEATWRFMGPSLGVVSLAGLYLVARPFVGWRFGIVFTLVLLSPLGGPLVRWVGGFWPTGLTVLLVVALTAALMRMALVNRAERWRIPAVVLVVGAALAVSSPLPAIQWVVAALAALAVSFGGTALLRSKAHKLAAMGGILALTCLVVLAIAVAVPYISPSGITPWTPPQELAKSSQVLSTATADVPEPATADVPEPATPLESAIDVARGMATIKFTGLLPGPVQLKGGAVLLLVISLLVIFVARNRPASPMMVLAVVSFFFGLILQTGLVTPYRYTGRAAVYGIALGTLLAVMLLRDACVYFGVERKPRRLTAGVVLLAIAVLGLVVSSPPRWVRTVVPDAAFVLANDLATTMPGACVETNVTGLELVEGLRVQTLKPPQLAARTCTALIIDAGYRSSSTENANRLLFFAGQSQGQSSDADQASFNRRNKLVDAASRSGWAVIRRLDGVVLMVRRAANE